VQPTQNYEIRVELVDGFISTPVQVVDLSLGGMGLLVEGVVNSFQVGRSVLLRLGIPALPPVEVRVAVRHVSMSFGLCGVEFEDQSEQASLTIRRAVSDLFERGSLA
jgi:c-di-GMP-binding flagellar brake protein YcgR